VIVIYFEKLLIDKQKLLSYNKKNLLFTCLFLFLLDEMIEKNISRRDALGLIAKSLTGAFIFSLNKNIVKETETNKISERNKNENLIIVHEGKREIPHIGDPNWIGNIQKIGDIFLFSQPPPGSDEKRMIVSSRLDGEAKVLVSEEKVPYSYLTDPSLVAQRERLALVFNAYHPRNLGENQDKIGVFLSRVGEPNNDLIKKLKGDLVFKELPISSHEEAGKMIDEIMGGRFSPEKRPAFDHFSSSEKPPVISYFCLLDKNFQQIGGFKEVFLADKNRYPYYPKIVDYQNGFLSVAEVLDFSKRSTKLFARAIRSDGEFVAPEEPILQSDNCSDFSLVRVGEEVLVVASSPNESGDFGHGVVGWLTENGKFGERFSIFPPIKDYDITEPRVAIISPSRVLVACDLRPVWWDPHSVLLCWYNLKDKRLERLGVLYTPLYWPDPHSIAIDRWGKVAVTIAGYYYGWRIPPHLVIIGENAEKNMGVLALGQIASETNSYLSFAKIVSFRDNRVDIVANSYDPNRVCSRPVLYTERIKQGFLS
jgi:hypothetical protein